VLGSCVATCLFDPEARVGGMNHFLLAEPPASSSATEIDEHYGVFLMELLINQMLARGAPSRLRAHLYGGANMRSGMAQIGSRNAEFARRFLRREGIVLSARICGGNPPAGSISARRAGQVRCRTVEPPWPP
jgi:chemotaxis protein CheD